MILRVLIFLLFLAIFTYGLFTYPFEGGRGWQAIWRANPGFAFLWLGLYVSTSLRAGELLGLWTVPSFMGWLCIAMAIVGGMWAWRGPGRHFDKIFYPLLLLSFGIQWISHGGFLW